MNCDFVDIHPHIISQDDSRYPRSPLFGVSRIGRGNALFRSRG